MSQEGPARDDLRRIVEADDFKLLVATQRRLAVRLVAVTCLIYFGLFILPMAFAPGLLAAPLWAGAGISRGLAAAVLVLVTAIATALYYTRRGNRDFDVMVRDIRVHYGLHKEEDSGGGAGK